MPHIENYYGWKASVKKQMMIDDTWDRFCGIRNQLRADENLDGRDLWIRAYDILESELAGEPVPEAEAKPEAPAEKPKTKGAQQGSKKHGKTAETQQRENLKAGGNGASPAKRPTVDVPKDTWGNRPKVDRLEAMEWVFDNYGISDLTPEDAPGPGAWFLLQWAKKNDANWGSFYMNMWTKTLPSRQQVEMQSRFTDDGRRQIELVEKLMALKEQVSDDQGGG